MRLLDKICVVTGAGAGAGIGHATAQLFAKEGATVVAADVDATAQGSMQGDLAPHGVRVNKLMPGTIMTPFVERYREEAYADREEGRLSIRRSAPHWRARQARAQVAYAAPYLASNESRLVFSSGLVVDGGLNAGKA